METDIYRWITQLDEDGAGQDPLGALKAFRPEVLGVSALGASQ